MENTGAPAVDLDPVPPEGLAEVLASCVFFGYQSVGHNLVDCMIGTCRSGGGDPCPRRETRARTRRPRLLPCTNRKNGDLLRKVRDFEALIRTGMGGSVDEALMKLFYIDIPEVMDLHAAFEQYHEALPQLEADCPDVRFSHFTVPRVSPDRKVKLFVKRLIGRQVIGPGDNVTREALNVLLRCKYAETGRLIDLARLESVDGEYPLSLCRDCTDDWGHLNDTGAMAIGERLFTFLISVAD